MIAIAVAILGYIGLDLPPELIKETVDSQLSQWSKEPAPAPERVLYQVVSVTDGDTLKVSRQGQTQIVRVLGIDSPETEFSERGEECFATEATAEARRLLTNQQVFLQSDDTQDRFDKYNRLLAYITLADGRDFGQQMIQQGFAQEYTFRNSYQNQQLYKAAEQQVRQQNLGLWACD